MRVDTFFDAEWQVPGVDRYDTMLPIQIGKDTYDVDLCQMKDLLTKMAFQYNDGEVLGFIKRIKKHKKIKLDT